MDDGKFQAENSELVKGNESSFGSGANKKEKLKFVTRFQQQQLEGWLFFPTFKCVVIFGITIGILMISIGVIFLSVTSKLEFSYDGSCNHNKICETKISIEEDIEGPVYLYYGISPYYQNYRDYVKSISYKQLAGKSSIAASTLNKECKPIKFISDLKREVYSVGGFYLSENKLANPCGLIAKSFFNDTYQLSDENNNQIQLITKDITHKIDRERVFKRNPYYYKDQYIDVENEHFINWIRFASTSWWQKLWAKIQLDTMKKGNYKLKIFNNYNVSSFNGVKSVMVSNSSSLGGRSRFLGGFFIFSGSVYLLMCVFLYFKRKRNDDDEAIDWSAFD